MLLWFCFLFGLFFGGNFPSCPQMNSQVCIQTHKPDQTKININGLIWLNVLRNSYTVPYLFCLKCRFSGQLFWNPDNGFDQPSFIQMDFLKEFYYKQQKLNPEQQPLRRPALAIMMAVWLHGDRHRPAGPKWIVNAGVISIMLVSSSNCRQ